jgi:eukaryotic-like serine/threonine-protein kinase
MSAPVNEGEILAGKYQVERVLGVGGMGIVVAARHLQLEQRVALKFLLPEALTNTDAVTRFEREARAAVKIQSEHVAKVLDVGKLENGAPYMVMEYLVGSDLADVVKTRGQVGTEEVVDWLLMTCEAMAEAHSLGIIHRDLKPRNLFAIRRPDGSSAVKVLDFGISKSISPGSGDSAGLTNTTAIMGSPLYMSPEQLRSSRDVDARTDIWAMGVILYELLAGEPPFSAPTMPQLCMAIVSDPPPALRQLRPDLPEGLEEVVMRCLEKEPANRFDNVAQLARALGEFATPRGQMSVERVARILQNVGMAETNQEWTARPHLPTNPSSSTSTAWAESQRAKRMSNVSPQAATGGTTGGTTLPPAPSNGPKIAMGVGALAFAGLAAAFFATRGQAAPTNAMAAQPAPIVIAAPTVGEHEKSITLKVSATPATAKIFVDDASLSGNPASAKMRLDGVGHPVRVEAAGFVTSTQMITFDKDIDLKITLEAEPVAVAKTAEPPKAVGGPLPVGGRAKPPAGGNGRPGLDKSNPYGN